MFARRRVVGLVGQFSSARFYSRREAKNASKHGKQDEGERIFMDPNIQKRPSFLRSHQDKQEMVFQFLEAKAKKGLTYDEIAKALGCTNVYAAQIVHLQAPVKDHHVPILQDLLEGTDFPVEFLHELRRCPMRTYDDDILDEPAIHRVMEAVRFNAESIKSLINEKLGDGIMSSVDMSISVDAIKGKKGEDRIKITFDGKFLSYSDQSTDTK